LSYGGIPLRAIVYQIAPPDANLSRVDPREVRGT
jgi:hypothetical protein